MLPFLSPQAPSHHSFPPADIAAISASLPNSPFFGFPLDNNLGQQQHQQHQQLLSGHNSTPHDAAQLFPSLSDTAFAAAAAAVTTSASSSSLTAGLLHDSLASVASAAMAVAAASSRPALSDDMLGVNMYPGPALSSALASLGGVHVSPDVATPSPAARTEAASDSTLFPGVVSSGVYMQGASALASSPAFWDMSGSLGVPIGSVTSASIQSPDTQLHDAMGSASSDAVAAAVAAMGLASSTENNGAVSVAIYPPPATNVSTLPAWDDMAAANSLSTVLGSPEMLMHIVQPSPPQAHYNLSAQATPAFDSLGAPLPNGLSPVQNQQQQLGELHMQTTPGTAASSGFASMADDGQSSMAAYFGTAVSIGPMSSSQETVVATSQPMLDQLKLFAVPPPQSMDVDLPTTSCPGY
ncbi:hypothetical protein IWW50_006029 [Coemansia erecta]|nr:hypothetical protein GGF43_003856 [Coemansia sp. RSA 2618]KAJ2817831.1 hypothetical protein IWW50_006029 [Coemansia erecta]